MYSSTIIVKRRFGYSSCFREEVMQTSEIMLIKYLLVCKTMHEFL